VSPASTTGPRLATPTRRAALLFGVSLVLLAAGMLRIDSAMASLGAAGFLLLALSWLLGRANLAKLDLDLDTPSRVFACAVFPMRLTLRNRRVWLDAFSVDIALDLPGATTAASLARWTPAGSAADVSLRCSVPVRGRARTHHARLTSAFPLGLFRFRRALLATAPMLVFPRPLTPIELLAAGVLLDAAPLEGASPGDAPGEPRGLRAYRAGDPPKRIHWAATLRSRACGRAPVARENDPPGFHPRHAQIVFHSFGADGELIRPDRFERALSLAAGTLRHLHALGIPATFTADFNHWRDLPARSRAQLSDCLETIADARRAPDTEIHDLQAVLARVHRSRTLILLSDMPADTWERHIPPRSLAPMTIDIRHHAGRGKRRLVTN